MSNESIKISAQHIQKHDIEANWKKATNFKPYRGQMIIYDAEIAEDGSTLELPESRITPYSYARFKLGDGINNVNDLPFSGTFESVGLVSNDSNALVQESNKSLASYTAAFGSNNINLSVYSMTEGLMNVTGVRFNNRLSCSVISSELDEERNAKITVQNLEENSLSKDDNIIIYASEYYFSCKVHSIEKIDEITSIISVINHNVSKPINDQSDKSLIEIYKVSEENISEDCHTEHLEGAYNISAATGDGANSSRVTHIEGHTNISFGQYNHLEGIRNKALGQTEMTHIEGRFNTADAQDDKVTANHIEGERNTVIKTGYGHTEGYNNKVTDSLHTHTDGIGNTVTDVSYGHIGGHSTVVSNSDHAFVHGRGLSVSNTSDQTVFGRFNKNNPDAAFILGNGEAGSSRDNLFEILKDGDIIYKDGSGNPVSLNDVHSNLAKNIQELTFKEEATYSMSDNNEVLYLIPPYDYKYVRSQNIDTLTIASRNELNNIYIYNSNGTGTKTLYGLNFTNNNGALNISGEYTGGTSWPQYYLHRSDINRLDLKPGNTYCLGIKYDANATQKVTLKFQYKDLNVSENTITLSTDGSSLVEFTWNDKCSLAKGTGLYIQANRENYSDFNVYPYIINKRCLDGGKDLDTWSPYKRLVYKNAKDLIEISEPVDAYIEMTSQNLGSLTFYTKTEIVSKDYVDEAISNIDYDSFATKEYVQDEISKIDYNSLVSDSELQEAINSIAIPSIEGLATEAYVDHNCNEIRAEVEKIAMNKDKNILALISNVNVESNYNYLYNFTDNVDAIKVHDSNNALEQIIKFNSRNVLPSNYRSTKYTTNVKLEGSQPIVWQSDATDNKVVLNGGPIITNDSWPQYYMLKSSDSTVNRITLCPGVVYSFGTLCDSVNFHITYSETFADGTTKNTTVRSAKGESATIEWKANYSLVDIFLQASQNVTFDNLEVHPYICLEGSIDSIYDWDQYSVEEYNSNYADYIYKSNNYNNSIVLKTTSGITNLTISEYTYLAYTTKEYVDTSDAEVLRAAQSYTDTAVAKLDVSSDKIQAIMNHIMGGGTLGLDYIFNGSTYECSGVGVSNESNISIPSKVFYIPVTSIGKESFKQCLNLVSVNIPSSVKLIDQWAFNGCSNLININIPDGLNTIGRGAFNSCSSLTSIFIPGSIDELDQDIFYNCSNLSEVNFDSNYSLSYIPVGTFQSCTNLGYINLPLTIEEIRSSAFSNCSNLQIIGIRSNIKKIYNNAFYNCNNLTDIYYELDEESWNKIEISLGNEILKTANIHFNSFLA